VGQRTFGAANSLQEKRQAVRNRLVCRHSPSFQRTLRQRCASRHEGILRPNKPERWFQSRINFIFTSTYLIVIRNHPMSCSTVNSERACAAQRGYARSTLQLRPTMKLRG